jgi:hypothetical protein
MAVSLGLENLQNTASFYLSNLPIYEDRQICKLSRSQSQETSESTGNEKNGETDPVPPTRRCPPAEALRPYDLSEQAGRNSIEVEDKNNLLGNSLDGLKNPGLGLEQPRGQWGLPSPVTNLAGAFPRIRCCAQSVSRGGRVTHGL